MHHRAIQPPGTDRTAKPGYADRTGAIMPVTEFREGRMPVLIHVREQGFAANVNSIAATGFPLPP